ncbi:hypothetical protein NNC19_10760 [Clostridium sp. SHJSY1]|uniref:hypothetical protein n=1 Tax=Clostridium sp. SHJSY1 TaxID=2942483 RepID=UPI002874B406|nr:hypothetical protein [Clostridium sp. SHJSY1]MDS0526163.1 hypothetical protein [Clostridium sp. SHJSY1]
MLEKFKKFPVVAQVAIGLQLVGAFWSIIGSFGLLNMSATESLIYELTGEHLPSKFMISLDIIVAIGLIVSLYLLVSNTNKKSVMIYFGIIVLYFILGIITNGFSFVTICGLFLPGLMAYTINENKDFFGL